MMMMAIALLASCGGAGHAPPAPPVVVATPDAGPVRPSEDECRAALARLWTAPEPPSAEAADAFVRDCQSSATQEAVRCVLAAEDPESLTQCGGFRDSP